MYKTESQDKIFSQIALFVVALHAILILWIIFIPFSYTPKQRQQNERLLVKTVQLTPWVEPPKVKPIVIETPIVSLPLAESLPEVIPEPPMQMEITQPEIPTPELEKTTPKPQKPVVKKEKPEESPKPEPVKKVEPKKTQTAKKTETKKKTPPAAKKQVKKQEVTKKTPAKKPDVVKKAETPKKEATVDKAQIKAQQQAQEKQKKLLAAAQESIAKIEQGRAKMSAAKSNPSTFATPIAITGLQIDALPTHEAPSMTPAELSYRDELASRLKLMLKLPEHGEVQLKLTLDRNGKVMKVAIVKSVSSANKSYVEKTLKGLKFPPFGNQFENMSEYTFIIHLSNEL